VDVCVHDAAPLPLFGIRAGSKRALRVQGHEDLRQDERVMQLFGLVNTMLAHDRTTAERDLSIARYAVIPLSPNSGAAPARKAFCYVEEGLGCLSSCYALTLSC